MKCRLVLKRYHGAYDGSSAGSEHKIIEVDLPVNPYPSGGQLASAWQVIGCEWLAAERKGGND